MPGGAKKFRSRHHFGRTRKKGRGRQLDGAATLLRDHVMDNQATTSPDNAVAVVTEDASRDSLHGVNSGPARVNADVIVTGDREVREIASRDNVRGVDLGRVGVNTDVIDVCEDATPDSLRSVDSGRVRIDAHVTGDREVCEARAHEKAALQRLSEMPATARKTEPFAQVSSAATAPVSDQCAAPYVAVNLDSLNSVLQVLRCERCYEPVQVKRGDCDYGFAVKLTVVCKNCGDIESDWSSPRVDGSKTCNPFEINLLATRAIMSTGNSQTVMNDVFAAMGLSRRGVHHSTFQKHLKQRWNLLPHERPRSL